jgi:hypothetical protein
MKHPGTTRPFLGPGGKVVPDSIAELNYLHIGGLDQWVTIQCRVLSVANEMSGGL